MLKCFWNIFHFPDEANEFYDLDELKKLLSSLPPTTTDTTEPVHEEPIGRLRSSRRRKTKEEKKEEKEEEKEKEGKDQVVRVKIFECKRFLPYAAAESILLRPLFQQLQILILTEFNDLLNLSDFVSAGIHLIPVLHLNHLHRLVFLYPARVIAKHKWVKIDFCRNLVDLSGLGSVSRVTISC
jgi:hypothetical protein